MPHKTKFRRLRLAAALLFAVVLIVSTVIEILSQSLPPYLLLALLMTGIVPLVELIAKVWDWLVPDTRIKPPSTGFVSKDSYLDGRLIEFRRQEQIFVPLAGESHVVSKFDVFAPDYDPEKKPTRLEEFDDVTQASQRFNQFILIGEPGAGKTTSLRQLVIRAIHDYQQRGGRECPMPLVINLGFSENPSDAEDLLRYWWNHYYQLEGNPLAELRNHTASLFLDGLNEMPEQGGSRQSRADSLRKLLQEHPTIHAVVTCRVHDYNEQLNLGLPVIRIQPLDEPRIKSVLDKRLGNQSLWEKIAPDPALRTMASNPYNLAMLIEIYQDRGQLPQDLNDLYKMYVHIRYDQYSRERKVRLPWEELEPKLQRLAFRMIAKGTGTAVATRWAKRQVGKKVIRDGINLGVLVEDKDTLRFYHQSLHSYFALPLLTQAIQKQFRHRRFFDNSSFLAQLGDLGAAAAPAVPALVEALRDKEREVQNSACIALGKIGEPAVPSLIKILEDSNSSVLRTFATFALSMIGEPAAPAVPVLVEALQDHDKFVRQLAAKTLSMIGESAAPAVPVLLGLLHDGDSEVEQAASDALGSIGESAVPALMEQFQDSDNAVRAKVAAILSKIGKSAAPAVPMLMKALLDNDTQVRRTAVKTLLATGESVASAVLALIEALHDSNELVRGAAAESLGELGDSAAVPALIEAVQDSNEWVRSVAAEALGELGDPVAIPALMKVLEDPIGWVRVSASKAIEKLRAKNQNG